MPVRYFCDRNGEEIEAGDTYFSLSITPNSSGGHPRDYPSREEKTYYGPDSQQISIEQTMSMVCRKCAIHISKEMRMQDSAEHA